MIDSLNGDHGADRVEGEMHHRRIHVERLKAPSRMTFDPDDHRRWHTMGVMWEGRQARYCIPLSLGEGQSDKETLRIPILAGSSGDGCYIQTRGYERVTINPDKSVTVVPIIRPTMETSEEVVPGLQRDVMESETQEDGSEVYERVVWKTVERDCHHPVLGPVVVVIEPSISWEVRDKDDCPSIVLCWEEDTSPLGGYDPGSRRALIEQIREDIEENRAELTVFFETDTEQLRHNLSDDDKARAERLVDELKEQIAFLREMEEKHARDEEDEKPI